MKFFIILAMLLSLTACDKSAEVQAKNPYADAPQDVKDAYQARMDEKLRVLNDPVENLKQTKKMMGE